MCGIAGKVDPRLSAGELRVKLQCMTDAIRHRGPDDQGFAVMDGAGIAMRRLSIIDVVGGQQPISNETESIHVVCNGEIYNFEELRSELQHRGHRFRSGSDAEVIVHLYEELGPACVNRLRGMFALAIWDRAAQRLVLARDRLGKKPLFYAQQGEQFWFASEMKSILADEPKLSTPDHTRLGEFFQFAYLRQPDTIYQNIHRLPAAHYGVFENGQFSLQPYWQVHFEEDATRTDAEWLEILDAKLAEAVRIRLQSEVPLGVFLSGGLDSSAIVAYANQAGLKPLKTFTVGFDRPEWDESEDARRVADHFGTEHHRLHISEAELRSSFVETLDAIIDHCDEPFGDASTIPTWHISRLAREHVTVILSGDGGDELFAGYTAYRGALFAETYRRWLPDWVGGSLLPSMAQASARCLPHGPRYRMLRVANVLRDSSLSLAEGFRNKASIWSRSDLSELFTSDLLESCDCLGEQYLPDPLWKTLHSQRELIAKLSEIDVNSYMLDDILVKVDRMSMAHSLEVRSPLLDHEVVECAARIPRHLKLNRSQGKLILRKLLAGRLPERSLKKGKQGFSVPLRDWFRGELREVVQDRLRSSDHLPPELFRAEAIERTLREHDRGLADHANRIWLLLAFGSWHARNSTRSNTWCDSVEIQQPLNSVAGGVI